MLNYVATSIRYSSWQNGRTNRTWRRLLPQAPKLGWRNALDLKTVQMEEDEILIRWPEKRSPDRSKVHVRNELEMPVPADVVWAWLIRAELWPTWYRNSRRVVIEGGGPDLRAGSSFRWTTFGVRLDSKVEEFVPSERLAWSARAMGIDAYHAWLIEKRASGCYVLTEETQKGWLANLSNMLRPRNMSTQHQDWLESLRRKAAEGAPPPK